MRTVLLTLEITYDPAIEDHPLEWDWRGAIGAGVRVAPQENALHEALRALRASKTPAAWSEHERALFGFLPEVD